MDLLVCLKQVPDLAAGVPDPEVGVAFPDHVEQVISTLDGYALEAAARIQDGCSNCSITLLSLDGEEALRSGYSVAGEEVMLVRDPDFEGSDPVAKGMILAAAAEELERRRGRTFDLILCGQQSADMGSGLTGPSLAEALRRPAVGGVLAAIPADGGFRLERETGRGVQTVEAPWGSVALVTRSDHPLHYPTILRNMMAVEMEVPVLHKKDLSAVDLTAVGRAGARVHTIKRFAPTAKADAVRISASSGEAAALELLHGLERARVL